jgi:hypothetical protein
MYASAPNFTTTDPRRPARTAGNLPGCEMLCPGDRRGDSKRGPAEASAVWKSASKRCSATPAEGDACPGFGHSTTGPGSGSRWRRPPGPAASTTSRGSSRSLPSHGTARSAGSARIGKKRRTP